MAAIENLGSYENPSLGSGSSPFKGKESDTFADSTTIRLAQEVKAMEKEVRHEWIGPMQVKDFFKEFLDIPGLTLPDMPTIPKHYFNAMPKRKDMKESDMYDPVIELIKKQGLLPDFQMVNTANTPDANSITGKKIKQAMTTYEDGVDTSTNPTQLDKDNLPWELKPSSAAEPFCDPPEDSTPENLADHIFETDNQAGISTRGQIATYLTEVAARQHRTHTFLVFMTDTNVRFLRADRTGIVVTRSFNYRTHSLLLAEFLWRFSHISDVARGLDPTVRPAGVEEEELAREKLSQWAPEKFHAVVIIQVPDITEKRGFREVIAWGSMSDAKSLTRATRGWPVYDLKAKTLAFLKDSWGSDVLHLEQESSILKELTAANVRNVPKYICGDDSGQTTRMQEFVTKAWKAGPTAESAKIKRFQHRLLTDVIGHRISTFQSSQQLTQAIYDAYLAHTNAFSICGILHRDISVGNILLSLGGTGILNDWDMARKVKDIRTGPRQPGRTGTWLFMSIKLLKDPTDLHELQDDLESFCYVVIYLALRYLPHNKVSVLPAIMANVFEHHYNVPNGVLGGNGKDSMVLTRGYIGKDLNYTNNEPLTSWVDAALRLFRDWYLYFDGANIADGPLRLVALKDQPLRDHEAFGQIFQAALAKTWPKNDKAKDHLPKGPSNKRTL
ncbi:hypothetical protein M413DRAFT_32162 [Hebeloma cylindrosporum]|uniref:Protein kinase domain-containing protein n=1 Tax=Hebeloma cylindrosporum TaxID=76867 RepID=A0A0C2XDE7_HEBCY|nr:hypothetical protein M413DRAFT_32162 [Hebeloma cylindrosporum h7]